ncbi:putative helicase MOV-10 [Toxorhynchites rutilus septentrionalis]|uniref:putative helicase MOV-10 n=1 Tax=Toxorhynchites rutilus septentrionalis TaxID=329112 RepID=UPI002478E4E8|nr:putative helicase MOV-10 [Toxorhynchites rutilus septentrionalis]XP_055628899.1 putative helicase MOV-10 [Toxorhynchites rutilus septentrionalis]
MSLENNEPSAGCSQIETAFQNLSLGSDEPPKESESPKREENKEVNQKTAKLPKKQKGSKFTADWKAEWKTTELRSTRLITPDSLGPESTDSSMFGMKFVQLNQPGPTFMLLVKNKSAARILLRTVTLMTVDKTLLAVHPGGEKSIMLRDDTWNGTVTFPPQQHEDIERIELHAMGMAIVGDDIKFMHERSSLIRIPETIRRTSIRLVDLPEFEIPPTITRLYFNDFKNNGTLGPEEVQLLARVEQSMVPLLRSSETYKQQLTLLNQIEDEHQSLQFLGYSINSPKMVKYREDLNRVYCLSIHQFHHRPALLKEGAEVNVLVSSKEIFRGTIDRIENEIVFIEMATPIFVDEVVRIEFRSNRTSYKLEYSAIELLDETVIDKLFFPETIGESKLETFTEFEWFRENISSNEEQMQAVKNIVNRTSFPAPYILFGPPGTGKTSTLTEAICQVLKLRPNSCVLVATASNFAANEIVNRLLTYIPSEQIFRIFAQSCERKARDIGVDVLDTSNLIRGSYVLPSYEDIYMSRVVVCTLTTAGRLPQAAVSPNHFDYIIVDECGCAKEISVLVAIAGIGTENTDINAQVVLAGDPKQLGPVIPYRFLQNTSHSTSMLERMIEHELYRKDSSGSYNPLVITQLRDSFRCHKALLGFSNMTFYDSQLRAKAPKEVANWALGWGRLPNTSFPLIFHPIKGESKMDLSSPSLYNEPEANMVLNYVQNLLIRGINGDRVEQKDIGVISPYARQVLFIRKLCNERGWREIEVGSTEQYQGREKRIILISTVRSQCSTVGFLADVKRMNVALTRARALLIVVGDPTTLERNTHWKKFIAYCRKNKAVFKFVKRSRKPITLTVIPKIIVTEATP